MSAAITKRGQEAERRFVGSLPMFEVDAVAFAGDTYTKLICPRAACGGSFLIDRPLPHVTAPCPHCFKVAKVHDNPEDGALFP